jgi:magnesium and cobalt transporter
MSSNNDSDDIPQRGWLERLSHALLREPQDREQLITLLRDAASRELLDKDALSMIEGVLQVSIMQVRDIMIPRAQMVVVEAHAPITEILHIATDSGHSRFPMIGDSRDEVVGILLAKDLLQYTANIPKDLDIKTLVRPCVVIPESKRLDKLLQDFRRNHQHMAIVVDEYGGVAGLVTIEDVLEQIVGDIEDEYDLDDEIYIKQQNPNQYIIKALTPVAEFNHHFDAELDDSDFDTVGGLVLHAFGHMPKAGEIVNLDQYQFKVLHADDRRVHMLQMIQFTPSNAAS